MNQLVVVQLAPHVVQVAAANARVRVREERLVIRRGGEGRDLFEEERGGQVQPGLAGESLGVDVVDSGTRSPPMKKKKLLFIKNTLHATNTAFCVWTVVHSRFIFVFTVSPAHARAERIRGVKLSFSPLLPSPNTPDPKPKTQNPELRTQHPKF